MVQTPPPTPAGINHRPALTAGFLLLAVAGLLVRVPSIAEPLGIDQSLWASAVNGMARGQTLYVDVFDQKPPGLFLIYLLSFSVFGWTSAAIGWLDLIASAATTGLLFLIGRRLDAPLTGALAAAAYAVLTMPSWLYSYGGFLERAVAETFVVICVGLAAVAASGLVRRASVGLAAGIGLALGTAVMFKPNAAIYFPALWAWVALYSGRRAMVTLRLAGIAAACALVTPALMLGWLWSQGAWPDTWIALVEFNRYYVGEGVTLQGFAIDFSKAVWLRMKTDPLWMAGLGGSILIGLTLSKRRALAPLPALTAVWGAAAALAIIANGVRLYNSYFIQALAPLSLLAAWLLIGALRRDVVHRVSGVIAAVAMLWMLLVARNYPARVYDTTAADASRLAGTLDETAYLERFGGYETGRGYSARANHELANYLRARTTVDDEIYLFGINGAGVYFLTDRLTANRFLRVNFFVPSGFPHPAFELQSVTAELARKRPAYIVFETLHSTSDMARLVDALEEDPAVVELLSGYRLETTIEDFTVYRRTD